VLNYLYAERFRTYFLEIPSRAILRQLDAYPVCLGPGANRWLMHSQDTADRPSAWAIYERERAEPLVRFLLDSGVGKPQFSPDGSRVVWGNASGAVTVVDLVEVNRRLSELGLGW
jgi:hypothetical protein